MILKLFQLKKTDTFKARLQRKLGIACFIVLPATILVLVIFNLQNTYYVPLLLGLNFTLGGFTVSLNDDRDVIIYFFPTVGIGLMVGFGYFQWGADEYRDLVKYGVFVAVLGVIILLGVLSNMKRISGNLHNRRVCTHEILAKYVGINLTVEGERTVKRSALELYYEGNTYYLIDRAFTKKERKTFAVGSMVPIKINPDNPNEFCRRPKALLLELRNAGTYLASISIVLLALMFPSV